MSAAKTCYNALTCPRVQCRISASAPTSYCASKIKLELSIQLEFPPPSIHQVNSPVVMQENPVGFQSPSSSKFPESP